MKTGERIKMFRLERGLTQKALADRCGMVDSALRKYESGKIIPKVETLQRISAAMDIMLVQLLFDEDEQAQGSFSMRSVPQRSSFRNRELLLFFDKLNDKGKKIAIERLRELTMIPDYQKKRISPLIEKSAEDPSNHY